MTAQDQQSRAELLPCPFCGQQDAFVEQLDTDASVVICDARISEHCACLARGPVAVRDDEDEMQPGRNAAIAAWNRRAPAVQAARALPAGMEPVAWLHINRLGASQTFTSEPPPGFKAQCAPLYTAAQVQAMGRVPPGWQAVPVEPTREMIWACKDTFVPRLALPVFVAAYKTMLAAAPRPPAAQEAA